MSVMRKKPAYCFDEFKVMDGKSFEQCDWNAILEHCLFGDDWEKVVGVALQTMWANQSIAEAQGFRYYIFQYKNPLVEHVVVADTYKIPDFKERISYEHNA